MTTVPISAETDRDDRVTASGDRPGGLRPSRPVAETRAPRVTESFRRLARQGERLVVIDLHAVSSSVRGELNVSGTIGAFRIGDGRAM